MKFKGCKYRYNCMLRDNSCKEVFAGRICFLSAELRLRYIMLKRKVYMLVKSISK